MTENNTADAPEASQPFENPTAQIEAFPDIPGPPGSTTEGEPAGGIAIPVIEEEPPKRKKKRGGRRPNVAPRREPQEPFEGGPPEPTPEIVDDEALPREGTLPKEPRRKKLSPRKLAEKTAGALDGGFKMIVNMRYKGVMLRIPNPANPTEILDVPPSALADTTSEEQAEVIAELVDVFEDLVISVTPMQSLAFTLAAVYGKKLVAIEMLAREQYRR